MSSLDTIKAHAAVQKRIPKKDVYQMFIDFADRMPEDVAHTNRDLLAAIYKSFMPPVGKIIDDPFKWVALAADLKAPKEYQRYVHVGEFWMIATDGTRLHAARNTGHLAPGCYYAKPGVLNPHMDNQIDHLYRRLEDLAGGTKAPVEVFSLEVGTVTANGKKYHRKRYNDAVRFNRGDFKLSMGVDRLVLESSDAIAVIAPMI